MDPVDVGMFGNKTGLLGEMRAGAQAALDFFTLHKANTDDPAVKKLLIDDGYLPETLQGNLDYTITDLYTK